MLSLTANFGSKDTADLGWVADTPTLPHSQVAHTPQFWHFHSQTFFLYKVSFQVAQRVPQYLVCSFST